MNDKPVNETEAERVERMRQMTELLRQMMRAPAWTPPKRKETA